MSSCPSFSYFTWANKESRKEYDIIHTCVLLSPGYRATSINSWLIATKKGHENLPKILKRNGKSICHTPFGLSRSCLFSLPTFSSLETCPPPLPWATTTFPYRQKSMTETANYYLIFSKIKTARKCHFLIFRS